MSEAYIGIDIGGTNFRMALIVRDGTIIRRIKEQSRICEGRALFCQRLLSSIQVLQSEASLRGDVVCGIGIGVPGLVDRDGVVVSSVNMKVLDGFNLADHVSRQTGVPVYCGNDANMIAMGEYSYGTLHDARSMVVITIGTGLGSGLILDGRLWSGVDGYAAEFGHVTVMPEGRECSCGNRGCLEQYVSAGGLVRTMYESQQSTVGSFGTTSHGAFEIAEMARGGNQDAVNAVESLGRWLGVGLSSLINTLNLEAIVITGGVAECLDLFEQKLHDELEQRCFSQMLTRLTVIKGALGDDAGLLGSVAMLMQHDKDNNF